MLLKFIAYFFLIIILSCNAIRKPIASKPEAQSVIVSSIYSKCYYYPYQTAFGKGRGIIFTISFIADLPIEIDSLIIGGKAIPFSISQTNPKIIEGNYLLNKPEPSPEFPEPQFPSDPIIDKQKFDPAYLIAKDTFTNIIKIDIVQFIKKIN